MTERDFSGLQRERLPPPDSVRAALEKRGLTGFDEGRPAYRQNRITRAEREETGRKRLGQSDELEAVAAIPEEEA